MIAIDDGDPVVGVVYRFFDAEGDLLYIGSTTNVDARMKAWMGKPEWSQVAKVTTERHDAWYFARYHEAAAILAENPRWNKRRTTPPTRFYAGCSGLDGTQPVILHADGTLDVEETELARFSWNSADDIDDDVVAARYALKLAQEEFDSALERQRRRDSERLQVSA